MFVRKGTEPALAPDNGYLAYVDNETILLTLGQSASPIAEGSSPRWTADGRHLVYAARDGLRSLSRSAAA
jgi:hypothetical protein